MAQLVTRLDDDLAAAVDELVADGVVESRSEAVRVGLRALVDRHRRRRTGEAIRTGYLHHPQDDADGGWSDDATIAMITDEPW